jgi:glycosyltransferase involved in cell wall biosynthesis
MLPLTSGAPPAAARSITRKTVRVRDRFVRACLVAMDRTAGRFRPVVRATCRYGIDLIDRGATAEFYALIRHRVRRATARLAPERPAASGPPIPIDARTERLSRDGRVVQKANRPLIHSRTGVPVLVTVVIPCFNYGQYVEEAVASVRAQTLGSPEIVVVDDGSTDVPTLAVLAGLAAARDVRLVRQENLGLPAARNRGIEEAGGEYICCLDADDTLSPTYLEQAIAVLEDDRSVGFVGSWVQFFGDSGEVWRTEDFDGERALIGNFTSVASVFRRDDWQAVGGFSPDMRGGFEDWEFWIRLATLGRRGRAIPQPLFNHRRHGRTMTHEAKAIQMELRQRMRRLCPEFYDDSQVRRRVGRLVGKRTEPRQFLTLMEPGAVTDDDRSGLIVVVTGLLAGGAHSLLHDIIRSLAHAWRIVVVTTGPGPHALDALFLGTTPEVFHLDGFLPQAAWGIFLEHLCSTRRARALLTSDCLWIFGQLAHLRAEYPKVQVFDLVHNHVPTSTFRAAVANSAAIDRHVVVSGRITDALTAAGIPPDRIAEIANGVDTTRFAPDRLDRDDARHRRALPPRPHLVLVWAGRMSEEKRPLLFVDLVETLRQTGPVHGVMFGEGPEASSVDDAIRGRSLDGCLERRAYISRAEMAEVYAAADLTVLTSRVEGMPLVVLEALACGCPVMSTDVGDVSRVVVHGENGYLVPVAEPAELLAHARTFARDPALQAQMRAEAAASLRRSPYQLSRMTASYARLFSA